MNTLLYFDSSVWLSYFLNDRHQAKAIKLMERIEEGNDQVLVSTLVLLEIFEVIRKRITEKENYVGLTESAKEEIREKIDKKTKEVMDKFTKLATQRKALLVDPDKSVKDYFQNTLEILLVHFGDVEQFNFCFTCNRSFETKYRYRGLGHYDTQHAINAKECSAKEIVSFDKAFSQLQNISQFSSLKVTVF